MLPLILLALSILTTAASSHPHPLDPLSPAELIAVRAAVLASPLVRARPLTFHYVGLDEPDKTGVLSYAEARSSSSRTALPRRAFVITRAGGQSHEFRVDITNPTAPTVLSHAIHHGAGFPTLTLDEQFEAATLPPRHAPFVESVRRRGLDLDDVLCAVFPVGWFGDAANTDSQKKGQQRRVVKVLCFMAGETPNFYARPIEGVTLVVDLDRMAIVEYKDRVVYPVPKAEGTDYRAGKAGASYTRHAAAPGVVVQPEGKGFHIDGHFVSFLVWRIPIRRTLTGRAPRTSGTLWSQSRLGGMACGMVCQIPPAASAHQLGQLPIQYRRSESSVQLLDALVLFAHTQQLLHDVTSLLT